MMVSSKVFEGYSDHFDAEVRLIILKALDDEQGKALNDSLIMVVLQEFAVRRSRDYLRIQLAWMEENGGAIRLTKRSLNGWMNMARRHVRDRASDRARCRASCAQQLDRRYQATVTAEVI